MACSSDQPSIKKIRFVKQAEPVWEGVYTAADPSVIRDGDTLRMYYSSLLINPTEKLLIAGAKSVDGLNWIPSDNIVGEESVALDVTPGTWDDHLEAVAVLKEGDEMLIYHIRTLLFSINTVGAITDVDSQS